MRTTDAGARARQRLRSDLESRGRLVVALSGGADSALLACEATTVLGRARVLCVTAVSPSLAVGELEGCRQLATERGLRWRAVGTAEMDDPAYVANGADRCYHCKSHLMTALVPLARAEGASVALGVNLDDLSDYRPGQRAAKEAGAVFPLVDARLTKADVRAASRSAGLVTWDKPAGACLASRLPYGTPVTIARLSSVDAAESALHRLGFDQVRVRHHGDVARVEVEESDLARALEHRREIVEVVGGCGFRHVALDLEGFRSGNLNRGLLGSTGRVDP